MYVCMEGVYVQSECPLACVVLAFSVCICLSLDSVKLPCKIWALRTKISNQQKSNYYLSTNLPSAYTFLPPKLDRQVWTQIGVGNLVRSSRFVSICPLAEAAVHVARQQYPQCVESARYCTWTSEYFF